MYRSRWRMLRSRGPSSTHCRGDWVQCFTGPWEVVSGSRPQTTQPNIRGVDACKMDKRHWQWCRHGNIYRRRRHTTHTWNSEEWTLWEIGKRLCTSAPPSPQGVSVCSAGPGYQLGHPRPGAGRLRGECLHGNRDSGLRGEE